MMLTYRFVDSRLRGHDGLSGISMRAILSVCGDGVCYADC